MKTNISKKVLAGTIAASFLLGLGYVGLSQSPAFAATSSSTSSAADSAASQTQGGKHGHNGAGLRGVNIMKEAASILGVDETTLKDSMKTGSKSLADLASEKGLSEDDFLTKLNAAVTSAIDAQVTAGTLTQDQATQLKSGLADRLKQQVENKGGTGRGSAANGTEDGSKGMGGGHGKGGPGGFMNLDTVAGILGMTQDEIRTELDAGKTLAEIAQAKGISEEDLIAKIKEGMSDKIKTFVESKHQKPAKPQASNGSTATDSTSSSTVTQ